MSKSIAMEYDYWVTVESARKNIKKHIQRALRDLQKNPRYAGDLEVPRMQLLHDLERVISEERAKIVKEYHEQMSLF